MQQNFTVDTPKDFLKIVETILVWAAENKRESLIITLVGDLGAGKTTFTQQLGQQLGVEEQITSPTFTIMKQYELSNTETPFTTLVHIDGYRLESDTELQPLHVEALLQQAGVIACIEWPEKLQTVLPTDILSVTIAITDGEQRNVTLTIPYK